MKLKPCPFCGSDSVNDTSPPDEDDPTMYWVCPWCVACGPVCQSLEDATEQWNTRAIPEPTEAMIEVGWKAMKGAGFSDPLLSDFDAFAIGCKATIKAQEEA